MPSYTYEPTYSEDKFFRTVNMNLNEIINVLADKVTADPAAPVVGQYWYNQTSGLLKYYNGAVKVIATLDDLPVNPFVFVDVIDCSGNPNYPAATVGDVYKVSVAGKIGGGSGVNVEVGDTLFCKTTGATGTQAQVGANWWINQTNLEAATTTLAGVVELATEAETKARTDADRAVTPAGLASFPRKFSAAFSSVSSVTVTAATHGLGATINLAVMAYQSGTPNTALAVVPSAPGAGQMTVTAASDGEVVLTFTGSISGHYIIIG